MPSFNTRPLHIIAAILLLGGLAACSTERYAEPIKGFSDAAARATDAVRDMNQSLADATLSYAMQAATDPNRGKLDLTKGDTCGAFVPVDNAEEAVRCRAEFVITAEGGTPVTIDRQAYTNPMGNMVAVMAAIQKYAANLAEVQSDNTKEKVNASLTQIQGNLVELAKAANPNAQVPAGLPEAAGQGVRWLFGQYIESVKFDALRKATKAAAQPLDDAALAFQGFAEEAKNLISVTAMDASAKAIRQRPDNTAATNRDALDKANAYDDLLTAPLSSMVDDLVDAHKRLEAALNGTGEVSIEEIFSRLEEIKGQAEEIATIAKNISAALKPKTT